MLIGLQAPWALSYDYHEEIVDLYRASVQAGGGGHSDLVPVGKPRLHTADLLYCNRHEKRGATELIITNLADVPSEHVNAT